MGRSKHLSKTEKETISYLCKKRYPIGKIAHLVGRHRRSVNRYKNYKLPKKIKKKEISKPIEPREPTEEDYKKASIREGFGFTLGE